MLYLYCTKKKNTERVIIYLASVINTETASLSKILDFLNFSHMLYNSKYSITSYINFIHTDIIKIQVNKSFRAALHVLKGC